MLEAACGNREFKGFFVVTQYIESVDKTSCDADVNIVLRMTSTAINGTSLMNDEEGTMNNSSFTNI